MDESQSWIMEWCSNYETCSGLKWVSSHLWLSNIFFHRESLTKWVSTCVSLLSLRALETVSCSKQTLENEGSHSNCLGVCISTTKSDMASAWNKVAYLQTLLWLHTLMFPTILDTEEDTSTFVHFKPNFSNLGNLVPWHNDTAVKHMKNVSFE